MSQKKLSLIFQYKAILLSFKFSGHKFETRKKKETKKITRKRRSKNKRVGKKTKLERKVLKLEKETVSSYYEVGSFKKRRNRKREAKAYFYHFFLLYTLEKVLES